MELTMIIQIIQVINQEIWEKAEYLELSIKNLNMLKSNQYRKLVLFIDIVVIIRILAYNVKHIIIIFLKNENRLKNW